MILAYAGRRLATSPGADLPPAAVPGLAARVARLLDALRPAAVVGAAAAGLDLVVLEVALARAIAAEVVLPAGRSEFRAGSVADAGRAWSHRYDRLLDAGRVTLHEHPLPGNPIDRYLAGNDLILDRAAEIGLGGPVGALGALGATREGGDVTAAFLTAAGDRGFGTVRLDPRTGAVAARGVPPPVDGVLGTAAPDAPPDLLRRLRDTLASRPGDRPPHQCDQVRPDEE